MDFLLALGLLIVGIIFVVKGGDVFVDAASWMAKAAGIPPFIVGATIVSLATTMPEMIVSCLAASEGKTEMAIGNAIGSVTANTALIMALAFLFMNVVIDRKKQWIQCMLMILCSAVLFFGSVEGYLASWASIVLIVIFIMFLVLNLFEAKRNQDEIETSVVKDKKTIVKNMALFVVGAAAIVIGSQCLVKGGSDLALLMGVSQRIIAITLVAVGTSLPELVTTLTAIKKKESALSVGNIIGANILDLSLILPLCSFISNKNLPVAAANIMIDLPVCLGVGILALIPLLAKEKAGKLQGSLLIVCYIAYLVVSL